MLAFALPFVATVILILLLRPVAPRFGLVDVPSARKRHAEVVPLVGGLAMFAAVAVVSAGLGFVREMPIGFFAGALLVVLVGVVDDRYAVSAMTRLGFQSAAVFLGTAFGGPILIDLGELLGPWTVELALVGLPLTVFGMVGVVNAINLSDGLDGLAGGISFTALVAIGVALYFIQGTGPLPVDVAGATHVLVALTGAIAGFLLFNLRTPWCLRASVFMGDAGSLFLGFVIGWLLVFVCSLPVGSRLYPVSALWIVIVPLFDTVASALRRKWLGRSPFRADAKHLHHLFRAWGCSQSATVAALVGANALGALIGVVGWRLDVPEYWMFCAILACFGLYMVVVSTAWEWIEHKHRRSFVLVRIYPTSPAAGSSNTS